MSEKPEKQWYVINTYAGQEQKVKEYLEKRRKSMGLEDYLSRILIAQEPVVEIKNGKQVTKNKNMFSGYILVEMDMTDEAWYKVRNTPGVTGFIGSSGKGAKPFPVPQEEVDAVLRRMGENPETLNINFTIGDTVKVLGGSFKDSTGRVIAIDPVKKTANIQLIFFGRETPTEFSLYDLEKQED